MSYLLIKNKGLIDARSFTILGGTVKGEHAIGMFGSGAKFAISYLLRHNHKFQVFSGYKEIPIGIETETFREKEFSMITVNGRKTDISTEFGKNDWELWMAIRELYCNALDEGEAIMEVTDELAPEANETHIYITLDNDVISFSERKDQFFSDKRHPIAITKYGKIYAPLTSTGIIYRKGIKCFETDKLIFDYDLNEIDINESRLVKYNWELHKKIFEIICACTDETIITTWIKKLSAPPGFTGTYLECEPSSYSGLHCFYPSVAFVNVINRMKIAASSMGGMLEDEHLWTFIPDKYYAVISGHISEEHRPKVSKQDDNFVKPLKDARLQTVLDEAMANYEISGINIPFRYELVICSNKKIMGLANMTNKTIQITDVCATRGVQETMNAIFEEYIHLKYEVRDCTRDFQDRCCAEIVQYLITKNNL